MLILPGIISYATNCLYSYQPLEIGELRVEGWLQLKGDGKCCPKWIQKAAGFISTHSVTCAAKRKQVTEECVLKPKHNTGAKMICCHLGRSVLLKTYILFTDLVSRICPRKDYYCPLKDTQVPLLLWLRIKFECSNCRYRKEGHANIETQMYFTVNLIWMLL